jgi:hypothetical protein
MFVAAFAAAGSLGPRPAVADPATASYQDSP